ncbi:hypothetical protein GCM10020000_81900 [Streptomyces olivoverticillatus]
MEHPWGMKGVVMPGGRLTQQERQQIAVGLADGLAYAEIARRLDRPTSTITREVTRNGGPTTYRADLAHRATQQRAHRRRQAAPGGRRRLSSPTDATPMPCATTRRPSPPSSWPRACPR